MYDYVRDTKDCYNERIKNVIQGEKIKKERYFRSNMEIEKKKALLSNILQQRGSSIIKNISLNKNQTQFENVEQLKSKRLNFAKKKTLGTQFLKEDIVKA